MHSYHYIINDTKILITYVIILTEVTQQKLSLTVVLYETAKKLQETLKLGCFVVIPSE